MKLKRPTGEPKPRRPKAAEVLGRPEAEQPEPGFDPFRELSPADWKKMNTMKDRLRDLDPKTDEHSFREAVSYTALLSFLKSIKGQALEIDPQIKHTLGVYISEEFKDPLSLSDPENSVTLMMEAKIIDPQIDLSPKHIQGKIQAYSRRIPKKLIDNLEAQRDEGGPVTYEMGMYEAGLILLKPDQRNQILAGNAVLSRYGRSLNKEILKDLELCRKNGWTKGLPDPDPAEFGYLLLVAPEIREKIKLTADDWARIKDRLVTLPHIVIGLTLLAAESAVITSDGRIQVTFPRQPLAPQRPLPERPQV